MQRKELYCTLHSRSAQIPSWDASALEHGDCVSIFHPIPLLWTMPLAALLCWEPQWPDCLSVCASGLQMLRSDVVQDQGDPGDAAASAPSGCPRLGEVRGRGVQPVSGHAAAKSRRQQPQTSMGFCGLLHQPFHGVPVSAGHTKLLEFSSSSAPVYEAFLPPAPCIFCM